MVSIDANSLKADAVTEIVTGIFAKTGITALGTVDFATIIKVIYAAVRGKIVQTDDDYKFYDDDGTTLLFTLTIATDERTVS